MKKKIALLMACVMAFGIAVGGTLAWLTAESVPVVNTFTNSDINITLVETKTDFQMVPGHTIAKDPKATVVTGSEECWLFVKLDKSENYDTYLTYEMAEGWNLVDGQTNVYARKIGANQIGTAYSVLKNDQVTVLGSVTKAMMETAKTSQPTLTITAYASQLYKSAGVEFSAAEAWHNISDPTDSVDYPAT